MNNISLTILTINIEKIPISNAQVTIGQRQLYQGTIGSTLYVDVWTQPNLLKCYSKHGQSAYKSGVKHFNALRNLYAYLNDPSSSWYFLSKPIFPHHLSHFFGFNGFLNSSHANNNQDYKSRNGYLF